jgi:hypothetical protein
VEEERQVNPRECLRHTRATLAYRGGKVLRGAGGRSTPAFGEPENRLNIANVWTTQ